MPKSSKQKRKKEKVIARTVSLKNDQKVISNKKFNALPNEIIHHVFSYLKIVDLLECGQVSKRFRSIICEDQFLWPKKINLCHKNVPVGLIQNLLNSGCKYLSLNEAVLDGTLNLPNVSSLKYLNLAAIKSDRQNSEEILESCYSLQKLSLSEFYLSSKLIRLTSLQNGKTLTVLDLSNCTFNRYNVHYEEHEFNCIQRIVENCTELIELSLYMTRLCEKSIEFLVFYLTPNIEKLDLYGQSLLKDKHVFTLVTRCNKMTELNLGGWTLITKQALNFIIEHLQETLIKLNFEYTNVDLGTSDLLKMNSMIKLRVLSYDNYDLYGKDWNDYVDFELLKEQLPSLRIISEVSKSGKRPSRKRIAIPCHPEYDHRRFWEINAEQEELFSAYIENS